MASQKPWILPLVLGGITFTETTETLTFLNDQRSLGLPLVIVSFHLTRHCRQTGMIDVNKLRISNEHVRVEMSMRKWKWR